MEKENTNPREMSVWEYGFKMMLSLMSTQELEKWKEETNKVSRIDIEMNLIDESMSSNMSFVIDRQIEKNKRLEKQEEINSLISSDIDSITTEGRPITWQFIVERYMNLSSLEAIEYERENYKLTPILCKELGINEPDDMGKFYELMEKCIKEHAIRNRW